MTLRTPGSRLVFVAFLLLLINSAYLAGFSSPSLWYYTQVALHPIIGIGLAAVVALAIARRRFAPGRLGAAGLLLCGVGLVLGAALFVTGATTAYRTLINAHVAVSAAGAACLLAWVTAAGARMATLRGSPYQPDVVSGFSRTAARTAIAATLVGVAALLVAGNIQHDRWRAEHRIVNPAEVPLKMEEEGAGPSSPFFPSSANTNVNGTIPSNFFMTSAACARCHKDIYDQWNSSAHHFSSFNNQWYRKSIEYMQDVLGTKPSKWCAGCHDHAVFFNGRFDRPIKEQIDTPEAQAGLACTSCHSITRVHSSMGQGDFTIEYPPLHDLAASENPVLRTLHDQLIYLSPRPHRDTFMKPFHREQTAEFCSSCHKVHLDVPVNDYRWVRGFNDYDNWQASGVSGQGARSFYYPPAPQRCADCHMPLVDSNDPAAKNGKVRSHRFPAANTALPYVNRDPVQLKAVQDFLRDGQISVDVFGIVRGAAPEGSPDGRATLSGSPGERSPADRPSPDGPQLSSTFAIVEE